MTHLAVMQYVGVLSNYFKFRTRNICVDIFLAFANSSKSLGRCRCTCPGFQAGDLKSEVT